EKQPFDPSRQGTVNAGVYILEPEVLDYIPAATPWSLERQLFPRLVREKQLVLGYLPEQPYYWIDVGHIEAYLQANYDAASGAWPWCNSGVDATARVASGAQIVPPVIIGAYATIEPGATVGPYTVIGEGSLIGRGAQVVRSVVWGAAVVGEGAKLHEAVVVSGASVNSQAEVIGQVVIAR
ncbi:MAG: NDP-sugar synthase, partial [Armatimonadetes bacterium]|nr:NDP-sugar synthase [Armatimonadota bacterium]